MGQLPPGLSDGPRELELGSLQSCPELRPRGLSFVSARGSVPACQLLPGEGPELRPHSSEDSVRAASSRGSQKQRRGAWS